MSEALSRGLGDHQGRPCMSICQGYTTYVGRLGDDQGHPYMSI
jgi:hypothetical protein